MDALIANTRNTSNKLIAIRSLLEQLYAVADPVSVGSAGFIEYSEAYSRYSSYFEDFPVKEHFKDTIMNEDHGQLILFVHTVLINSLILAVLIKRGVLRAA